MNAVVSALPVGCGGVIAGLVEEEVLNWFWEVGLGTYKRKLLWAERRAG